MGKKPISILIGILMIGTFVFLSGYFLKDYQTGFIRDTDKITCEETNE